MSGLCVVFGRVGWFGFVVGFRRRLSVVRQIGRPPCMLAATAVERLVRDPGLDDGFKAHQSDVAAPRTRNVAQVYGLSDYDLSESDAGSNTSECVQLRSEKSADTAPFFRLRPNAETRHRRPCDDTDAVYHRAGVRRILAVAERTVRKWIRASVRTAYGFESEWRTHGRTRQHSSSGCVWALGRWRFLFPADHRPLHFALCAIPLELDLFTANSVLQMDRAGRPAVTAVAWSSKSNRRFRHRTTNTKRTRGSQREISRGSRLWRQQCAAKSPAAPGCGSLASWCGADLMPGTRPQSSNNSSRCVARVAKTDALCSRRRPE